jgi:uncharacterized protein (UPF0248 family)
MRLIKAFLVGAIGLFIVITLLSLLIPSTVKVSRTTLINNTTSAKVLDQVVNLSNWKNWHPVFKNSDTKINIPDAVSGGNSAEIRYGDKSAKLLISASDSNTVKFTLQSPGENDIQNEILISPIPNQSNVQVEWRALNQLKWYPWEKFYGIFIDKLTGPGYDAALKDLKDYLETRH